MVEATRIRRNSLFSLISSATRVLTNFVLFWLIARVYSEEIFGQFTFAQTLATNFLFLADFGFDILLTTEVARERNKAKELFQKYFSLKIIFSITALFAMWIFALSVFNISKDARTLIFIFSFYMIFSALSNFIFAFFKGLEKLEYETLVTFIINLLLLAATVLFILLRLNIIIISITFLLSRILGFTLSLFYSAKVKSDLSFRLDYSDLSETKKKIFVFGTFLLFNNILFQVDTIMLGFVGNDYQIGVYQSVFKFILLPLIIPDIITNALMPTLSRYFSEDKSQWQRTGYLMNKILSILSVPIALFLFVYAEQIVHFLYGGNKFLKAIPVLQLISISFFFRFSFEAFSLMLTTSNRQHYRMITVIAATIINIILNSLLIPKYGAYGAAVVSVVTNFFVVIVYLVIQKEIFRQWILSSYSIALYITTSILLFAAWNIRLNMFIGGGMILIVIFSFAYFFYFTQAEKEILFSTEFGLRGKEKSQ